MEEKGDLHTRRLSHVSIPVEQGMEWHLSKKGPGAKPDPKADMMHIPVKKTSDEGDAVRFKQVGKPRAEKTHGHEVVRLNKSD